MTENQTLSLAVGRMEGQMREVVHTVNNLALKFEELARSVDRSAHLPMALDECKKDIAAVTARVAALEALEHQRKGAFTLGAAIAKCLPWLGPVSLIGAAATVIAKIGGI